MPPVYVEGTNEVSSKVFYQQRHGPIPDIPHLQAPTIMALCSHYPEPCICPYCHQSIVTRIEKKNGVVVYLAAAGICLLGFALGCCLIPFLIDGIKDTIHYCPNCHQIIGRKKRI